MDPDPSRSQKQLPKLKSQLRKLSGRLAGASFAFVAEALVIVALPWPAKFALDTLFWRPAALSAGTSSENIRQTIGALSLTYWPGARFLRTPSLALYFVFIAILALTVLAALLRWASERMKMRVSRTLSERVRNELLKIIVTREQTFMDRHKKMDLLDRLTGDLGELENLVNGTLHALLRGGAIVLFALVVLVLIDLRMAVIFAVILPGLFLSTTYFSKRARLANKRAQGESEHLDGELQQLLSTLAPLKSLAVENLALNALFLRSERSFRQTFSAKSSEASARVLEGVSKNVVRALILLIGGGSVFAGDMTLGSLALAFFYVDILLRPISDMAQFYAQSGKWLASSQRIEALYQDMDGHQEHEGTQSISSLPFPDATALHFENVSFGFKNSPVLIKNFSASIRPGELIAIAGSGQSGRSTFVKLFNRLLDPTTGRILLGRTDIRRFRLKLLRNSVTVVLREAFFLHGTVLENLLLGVGEEFERPTESALSEALHAADCDFIASLPMKLQTLIGEGGYSLTTSELQRLNLARAFLRSDSRVLVFDEPTIGLSAESTEIIAESIAKLTETGRIVFWVTDALDDLLLADRVLFFKSRSPVLAMASHAELLQADASYRHYVQQLELKTEAAEILGGQGPHASSTAGPFGNKIATRYDFFQDDPVRTNAFDEKVVTVEKT